MGGAIISLYNSLHPSVFKFCQIFIEKCEKLKYSLIDGPCPPQKKFSLFIISLCLMREVKIRFISLSVFQFIFEKFD